MTRGRFGGISINRRRLMAAVIAGGAAAAAPAGLLAAQCGGGAAAGAGNAFDNDSAGRKLIVSGRILGAGCRPLAGAAVEAWHAHELPVRAITDADGRFLLTTQVPAGGRGDAPRLSYQVTHPGHDRRVRQLQFTREAARSTDGVAQVVRDEAGVWRAGFGLTLA